MPLRCPSPSPVSPLLAPFPSPLTHAAPPPWPPALTARCRYPLIPPHREQPQEFSPSSTELERKASSLPARVWPPPLTLSAPLRSTSPRHRWAWHRVRKLSRSPTPAASN